LACAEEQADQELHARRRLEQELVASTLAAISAKDQVSGLADTELQALEEAVRLELWLRSVMYEAARHEMQGQAQAEARREIEAMRSAMRTEMELDREALRRDRGRKLCSARSATSGRRILLLAAGTSAAPSALAASSRFALSAIPKSAQGCPSFSELTVRSR
jgi:hypothetical protein